MNKFSDHDLSNPQFIQQKRSISEQDEKTLNDILGKMGVKEASPDKPSIIDGQPPIQFQNEFSPSKMPTNNAAPSEVDHKQQSETPKYSDNFHDLSGSDMRSNKKSSIQATPKSIGRDSSAFYDSGMNNS